MEPSRFDDLTKALASATSRRQALKTIAATTIGGILGLGGIGSAFAKNMTCAQWCAAVFGDNTPADEQCSADAAHHTGLCYSCGPQSPGGGVTPSSICCTRTSSGYCTSYSSATCCGSSATCLNGSCCANANVCGSTCLAAPCDSSQCLKCDPTSGTCVGCPSGQSCLNGSCCPNSQVCNGVCCPSGQSCLNGSCCPNSRVCNGVCCPPTQSCQSGQCGCGPGQVKLCNGTCATPCPQGSTCSCGDCDFDNDFENFYCTSGFVGGFCTSDCDCPTGLFCVVTQSCWAAC
jgi:hypothetical protein